tara:strand:+ start:5299 stop:5658 length:360 start_codon:yes stop_codon:yes gene_type:complete
MSRLELILSAISFISIVFNIGVFIYARAAIARLLFVSEELGDLQQMVNAFAKHTKSVYELDMFYGDPTLEHLMNHAVSFSEQLETFEFIYALTEKEIDDNDNNDNRDNPKEETPEEEVD